MKLELLNETAEALKKNGFEAAVFEDAPSAIRHVLKLIGSGKKVGMGGSMTVRLPGA